MKLFNKKFIKEMSIRIDQYCINFDKTNINATLVDKTWHAVINKDQYDFLLKKISVDLLNYVLEIEEKNDKLLLKFKSRCLGKEIEDCIELKPTFKEVKSPYDEQLNTLIENKNLFEQYQLKINEISNDIEYLTKEYDLQLNILKNKKNDIISKITDLCSNNRNILEKFNLEYNETTEVLEVLTIEQYKKFMLLNDFINLKNYKIDLNIFYQLDIVLIFKVLSFPDLKKFIGNIININIIIENNNLLQIYCEKFDCPEIVKILLDKGIDIEGKVNNNNSPLGLALSRKKYKIAILLLDNNADVRMNSSCSMNIHSDIPMEVCEKIIQNAKKNNNLCYYKEYIEILKSDILKEMIRNS